MYTILKEMVTTREGGQTRTHTFCREEDGMVMGQVQAPGVATYGDDPRSQKVRYFLNEECAISWVKDQCREYERREDIDFHLEDRELRGRLEVTLPRNLKV